MDKRTESESCKYCNANVYGRTVCLDHSERIWLSYPNKLSIQFHESMNEINISYCPICGRRLL